MPKVPASVLQDLNPAEIPTPKEDKKDKPKESVAVIWTSVKEFVIPRKYKIISSVLIGVPVSVIVFAFLVKGIFFDLASYLKLSEYRDVVPIPITKRFSEQFNGRSLNKKHWIYEEIESEDIVKIELGKLYLKIPKLTVSEKQVFYNEKIEGFYTIEADLNCNFESNLDMNSEAGIMLSRGAGASMEYVSVMCTKTYEFGPTIYMFFNQNGNFTKPFEQGFLNNTDLKIKFRRSPGKIVATITDRGVDFQMGTIEAEMVNYLDTLVLHASNKSPDYPGIEVAFDNITIR